MRISFVFVFSSVGTHTVIYELFITAQMLCAPKCVFACECVHINTE